MRILITGISGFIGTKLAELLLRAEHEVVGFDVRAPVGPWSEHGHFRFVAGDICSTEALQQIDFVRLDAVFHLAAAGVKVSSRTWPICTQVNVLGTATLFGELSRAVQQAGVPAPRIIYTKSFYEDHWESIPAFRENPYVMTKVAATRWIESVAAMALPDIRIAKVYQVFGANDDPNNVLSYAARQLLAGEPAEFGAGQGIRDWIHIDDFVAGLYACLRAEPDGLARYDLGSQIGVSIRDAVEKIAALVDADPTLLLFDSSRDRGDAAIHDLASTYPPGWQPTLSFGDGLRRLIADFR